MLRAKIQEIELTALKQWKAQFGYDQRKQIYLTLRQQSNKDDEKGIFLSLEGCCEKIRQARKVILTGVPGAGKAITLLQIAERLLENHNTPVPIVISLPEWAETGEALIPFVSRRPNYRASGISEGELALLNGAGRVVFLLNGWNEISAESTSAALLSLKGMIRDSSATAFVITTRDTQIAPPVIDPIKIHIEALNFEQRRIIVSSSDLTDPSLLLAAIEHEPALDEITRVPLFLAGVIEIAKQRRSIPRSRYGIVRTLVEGIEQSPEHAGALLDEPCKGRCRDYLLAIAEIMCRRGLTTLAADEALQLVGTCSHKLLQEYILGRVPDAKCVLDCLISHHVLIGAQTDRGLTVRFIHQQFQEWLASESLYMQFSTLAESDAFWFQKDIINDPFWEEPILFLAERLNPSNSVESESHLADKLIRMTIPVDLVLAARLARLVDWKNLERAREELSRNLRALYAKPEVLCRKYALTCMLATGTDHFADIYQPLIENSESQVRLQFYRTWQPFPLTALGDEPVSRIRTWDEERRAEFVHEIMLYPEVTHFDLVTHLARSDLNPKVWISALHMLAWARAYDTVISILQDERAEVWPDEVFASVLDLIPRRVLGSILLRMKSALATLSQPHARLFVLSTLDDLGDSEAENYLKQELELDSPDNSLAAILPRLYRKDPGWVSLWLGRKMQEGKCWDEKWVEYLGHASSELVVPLAESACDSVLDLNEAYKRVRVLVKLDAEVTTKILIQNWLNIQTAQFHSYDDALAKRQGALQVGELPLQSIVRACRSIDETPLDSYRVQALLNLLSPGSPYAEEESQELLAPKDRQWLRNLIYKWDASVPPLKNDQGGRRAYLAALLGFIGTDDDVATIHKWIRDDSSRVRETKSPMRYTNWYAGALANLNTDQASDVLLKLLTEEADYLGYAASALFKIIRAEDGASWAPSFGGPDYKGVFNKRQARQAGSRVQARNPKKDKFASAILEAVRKSTQNLKAGDDYYAMLQMDGTVSLAHLAEEECVPILLQARNLDALTVLVTRGLLLPGDATFALVNPIISKLEAEYRFTNHDEWYVAEQCLALLLFSDQPHLGVHRIRKIPDHIWKSYKARELVRLLGFSQAQEAAEFLAELSDKYEVIRFCSHEYLRALVACKQPAARRAVLGLLDKLASGMIVGQEIHGTLVTELGSALAEVARNDTEIYSELVSRCEAETNQAARQVLMEALREIGTEEALLPACRLVRDHRDRPMWEEPPYFLEDLFIDKVPAGSHGTYYRRSKPLAKLRNILLEQALHDPVRKKSSLMLLMTIEFLRLDLGRPIREPRHPDITMLEQTNTPWPLGDS